MQYNLQDARTLKVKWVLEGFNSLVSLHVTLDFTWFRYPPLAVNALRTMFQQEGLEIFFGSWEFPFSHRMCYFIPRWLPDCIRAVLQQLEIRMERTDAYPWEPEEEGFHLQDAYTEYMSTTDEVRLLVGSVRPAWFARASVAFTLNNWENVYDDRRGEPDLGVLHRFLTQHLPSDEGLPELKRFALPPLILGTVELSTREESKARAHAIVSELLQLCDHSRYLMTVTLIIEEDLMDLFHEALDLGENRQRLVTGDSDPLQEVEEGDSYRKVVFKFHDPRPGHHLWAGVDWMDHDDHNPFYDTPSVTSSDSASDTDSDMPDLED
jgi:hypothetical protein